MGMRKLVGLVSPSWREPSTCEACGNSFTCGATLRGCWCTEVKLSEPQRARLRTLYQHCLCRECLERFASTDQDEASAGDALSAN